MITWTGHGYLVAVFVFGTSFLMEWATESAFNDDNFYQRESWPLALALVIAGLLSFFVGQRLNTAGERVLVDPETEEQISVSTANHTLFFLKMHWWGPILFGIAAIVLAQRIGA